MRFLTGLLCGLMLALPVRAQENSSLVVPFAEFPPFLFRDDDGARTGFITELAEMLGEEIGVPIEYLDVDNSQEWVAALASGEAQLIPGVLKLPPLAAANVFSTKVATDALRPAVLAENLDLIASGDLSGRRVAIVPPAMGSEEPILAQNTPVAFSSPQEALFDLLAGKVDAVLLPPSVVYRLARDAGFDGRIAFIGEPLRETSCHVALHRDRAELMPAINAAISRMEADGRLEALRQRFGISPPRPPPDILQVGIAHVPPLSIIDGSEISGFAVEVTRNLAERANVDIAFAPLPVSEWVKGPTALGLDAVSVLVITPDRRARFDFPYPVVERSVAVVLDADDDAAPDTYADLAGRRVGIIAGSVFANLVEAPAPFELVGFETFDAMFAAQLAQDIDVILTAPDVAEREIERLGADAQLRIRVLGDETIGSSIALRPGLGAVRQRLNAVMPGYLVSD